MENDVKTVPLRKIEVYHSDDGRRIEHLKKISDISFKTNDEGSENDNVQFDGQDDVYVGSVYVGTQFGPKEIKFTIDDANDIEEAFDVFYDHAEVAWNEFVENVKKQQQQQAISSGFEGNANAGLIIP